MARKAMFGWVVVVQLALMAVAARSEAALGCTDVGPPGNVVNVATCAVDEDCAAVGGTACTVGFCLCNLDPLAPCPCLPAAPAPALSHGVLIGLAGLLTAAGLLLLWRRAGGSGRNLA